MPKVKAFDQNAEKWKRANRLFTSPVLAAGALGLSPNSYTRFWLHLNFFTVKMNFVDLSRMRERERERDSEGERERESGWERVSIL